MSTEIAHFSGRVLRPVGQRVALNEFCTRHMLVAKPNRKVPAALEPVRKYRFAFIFAESVNPFGGGMTSAHVVLDRESSAASHSAAAR